LEFSRFLGRKQLKGAKMDDSIYWPAFHQKRLQKIAYTILAAASIEAYRTIKGSDPTNVCDIGCSSGILLYRLKEQMPALVTHIGGIRALDGSVGLNGGSCKDCVGYLLQPLLVECRPID
jgi:hypothetical protein